MEQEPSLQWLRRQGHQVLDTLSSVWYDIGPKIYQAFPYHKLITPSVAEINNFFKQSKAVAIRYSVPVKEKEGQISYHVLYNKHDPYDLKNLPKKARHDIAKGMQYASYEQISVERLANEGWFLRKQTLIRQGRDNAESRTFWETLCLSAKGLSCCEAWGAIHEGQLVASLFACTMGDTVSILYQQSLTDHLKYGVNNALTYVFTSEALKRPDVQSIFYGLHSLDAPASVDEYKFRMGYFAKPVRQRVVFNPYIAPFINPSSHKFLKYLIKVFPTSYIITKAEGMIRFSVQGRYPLKDQEWPEALLDQRNDILALVR